MKKILKILKKRELYFTLIIYPLSVLFAKFLNKNFNSLANANYTYYGFLSFTISVVVVVLVVAEIFMKLHSYGLQGDKLKIRQREGINIGDK